MSAPANQPPAAASTGGDTASADAARLAEAVRRACVQAALEGYESAAISGLCHEGCWECAVDAIRALDLRAITVPPPPPPLAAGEP